jgi:hypothetical protein
MKMSTRQTIMFGIAWVLFTGLVFVLLRGVDASEELAATVLAVLAVAGGTLIGVFGERTEDEPAERPRPRLAERPHTP